MKNLKLFFVFLFFTSIAVADTPFVTPLPLPLIENTVSLKLSGPEDIYLIIENGPDVVKVTGPGGIATIKNNIEGESDFVVLSEIPQAPSRFYVWLTPWETGFLTGWLSSDKHPELWTELLIAKSGFTKPVRPDPSYQPQFAIMVAGVGAQVAIPMSVNPNGGKLAATWGKIKVAR